MKKTVTIILFLCLLIMIIGSVLTPKNMDGDITGDIVAPDDVKIILKKSCYDCHSYETKYPFYSKIFPVSLLINNHIKEGREEINFSTFEQLSDTKKSSKLKSLVEDIESNEMPLFGYTLLHPDAVLSDEEKIILIEWAKSISGDGEDDEN